MKALRYMVLANLKMSFRNRTALFWNLAFPLLFIVLFGFLFQGDDLTIRVGVVGDDVAPVAEEVTAQLRDADGFAVTTGSRDEELERLQDGDRSVVVIFSPGAEPGRLQADLFWDESDPQIGRVSLNAVQQFLSEANTRFAAGDPPIETTVQAVAANDLEYMDFLIPGILAMAIMNSGMIGLSSAFVTYREKGILRRIRATPFPLSSFIAARIISQVVISVAQAVVLIVAGMLIVDLTITGSLLDVFVMVLIGSLAFLALGFVISAFARNQESAESLSNALSFPMLFLGGVFFPVDSAPSWLQPIMRLVPLRYLADALRGVMVRGESLPSEWVNIVVLLATAAIAFLLAVRLFRWEPSAA